MNSADEGLSTPSNSFFMLRSELEDNMSPWSLHTRDEVEDEVSICDEEEEEVELCLDLLSDLKIWLYLFDRLNLEYILLK